MSPEIDKLAWLHVREPAGSQRPLPRQGRLLPAGGKREPGESDEEALIREVREELAVDLVPETLALPGTFKAQAARPSASRELVSSSGLAASWFLARTLGSLLFGVTTADPVTYLGMVAVLISVATLAGYLPRPPRGENQSSYGPSAPISSSTWKSFRPSQLYAAGLLLGAFLIACGPRVDESLKSCARPARQALIHSQRYVQSRSPAGPPLDGRRLL